MIQVLKMAVKKKIHYEHYRRLKYMYIYILSAICWIILHFPTLREPGALLIHKSIYIYRYKILYAWYPWCVFLYCPHPVIYLLLSFHPSVLSLSYLVCSWERQAQSQKYKCASWLMSHCEAAFPPHCL